MHLFSQKHPSAVLLDCHPDTGLRAPSLQTFLDVKASQKKELTDLSMIGTLAQPMSRICSKTGKKTSFGNTRSHSLRSTRRNWQVNMVKKRIFDPATGEFKTMKVAASYLRTLAKRIQQGKPV